MAIARPDAGGALDASAGLPSAPPGTTSDRALPEPPLELEEPGTILFTARRALQGKALNRFALSLRSDANRDAFLADPRGYASGYGLREDELGMLQRRDWTGLLLAGAHVLALLKVAATVGEDLWDIGANSVGTGRDALMAACPRVVQAIPDAP